MNAIRHNVAIRALNFLGDKPKLYFLARRTLGKLDALCVTPDSELVIEGYPRSANSTTVHGFLARQRRPVRVAHHKPHAAQLLRALELGIPAVVLIRKPSDAILSNIALAVEAQRRTAGSARGRGAFLSFRDATSWWLSFYTAVAPHRDRLLVASFEEVTADLSVTIQRINDRFGRDYVTEVPSEAVEPSLGWHARPNPLRAEIKNEVNVLFEEAAASDRHLQHLLARCDLRYAEFMSDASTSR